MEIRNIQQRLETPYAKNTRKPVMPPKPLPRLAVTFLMADSNTLDHDAGYTLAERISEDSRDVTLMIVGSSLIETGSPDAA